MKLKVLLLTLTLTLSLSALDCSAQLAVKKGSFVTNTDTNNQSVTGVGLGVAGKVVIFFGRYDGTGGGGGDGTFSYIWQWYGFATSSTNRGSRWIYIVDNVITTVAFRGGSDTRCIFQQDSAANNRLQADFVSFDGTDGNFTIDWITAPAVASTVHYIVIGGTDLTNQVVTALALNASTGNQSYAHGLGATPDFAMFVGINNTALTAAAHATLCLGWAVSDTKRGSVSINASDGETMEANQDQMRVLASDRALICMGNSVQTVDIELDFVSFDSTNVTFNQINAPTANTDLLALFLAGGQYDAGSFSARTTTGDDNFTVGFVPKGVMLAMANGITSGTAHTATANANMAIGAFSSTDGTQEGSVSVSSTDAIEPTQADQRTVTTKAITSLVNGNPGSVDGEADGTALGTTSTINWSDAPATADIVLWFAIGDAGAAPPASTVERRIIITENKPRRIITSIEPREYEEVCKEGLCR